MLELFAIYCACATWDGEWSGKRIVIHSDNSPIIEAWQSGTSKSKPIMFFIRKIFFTAAQCQYSLSLKFVPGCSNKLADILSRFQMIQFRQLAPDAELSPTPIPNHVWMLTDLCMDYGLK